MRERLPQRLVSGSSWLGSSPPPLCSSRRSSSRRSGDLLVVVGRLGLMRAGSAPPITVGPSPSGALQLWRRWPPQLVVVTLLDLVSLAHNRCCHPAAMQGVQFDLCRSPTSSAGAAFLSSTSDSTAGRRRASLGQSVSSGSALVMSPNSLCSAQLGR